MALPPPPRRCAIVYRNIERRTELCGVEFFDAIGLLLIAWMLAYVGAVSLPYVALTLVFLYVLLRLAKRGKPAGHTTALLRYTFLRPPFLSAAEPDYRGRSHPFCPPPCQETSCTPPPISTSR